MPKVDMSANAVTTRLKRVSQLRRLGLALQKAKIRPQESKSDAGERQEEPSSKPGKRRKK